MKSIAMILASVCFFVLFLLLLIIDVKHGKPTNRLSRMRTRLALLFAGGLLLCQGCGSGPQIAPVSEASIILAFGDSLTAGTGAEPNESYPHILAGILGCRVVNAGVPGETTEAGVTRLNERLRLEKVNLVILCEGGNDMIQKRGDEAIQRGLSAMVSACRESGADVVLLGVPRIGLRLKSPDFYQRVADQHGIPYDGITIPAILATPSLKSDYIHPNASGYRKLAESVADAIRKHSR